MSNITVICFFLYKFPSIIINIWEQKKSNLRLPKQTEN